MDKYSLLLSFLFLSTFAFESNAQDYNYVKSVDDCYSSIEFQKSRYRYKHQNECYVGNYIPSFEIFTMDGKLINNESLKGKITVINFWFTACPPCVAEMPGLSQVSKKYAKEDINFIAASIDSYETIERFIKKKGNFGFTLVPDASNLFYETLHIQSGFPTTIVIDEEGIIQFFLTGGLADFRASRKIRKKLSAAIDDLLE